MKSLEMMVFEFGEPSQIDLSSGEWICLHFQE